MRIGRFILRGGGPLYEIPLIDVSKNGTYLMFPRGLRLVVGEIFEIVRPIRISGDFLRKPERLRRVVARVKVVSVEAESRARVHVLSGSVIKGSWAERPEDDRRAPLLQRFLNVLSFFSIVRANPRPRPQAGQRSVGLR